MLSEAPVLPPTLQTTSTIPTPRSKSTAPKYTPNTAVLPTLRPQQDLTPRLPRGDDTARTGTGMGMTNQWGALVHNGNTTSRMQTGMGTGATMTGTQAALFEYSRGKPMKNQP
jgi:hypothetical protein